MLFGSPGSSSQKLCAAVLCARCDHVPGAVCCPTGSGSPVRLLAGRGPVTGTRADGFGYGRAMAAPPAPPPVVSWRTRLKKHALRLWERRVSWRRGLSWSAVLVGGLTAAVALWPLAATVWDLLGLTPVQAWRVAAGTGGAVLLAAGVAGVNWKRTSPVRLAWLIPAAWAVAAVAVTAMTALAWLALDTPQWQPPGELTPKALTAAMI